MVVQGWWRWWWWTLPSPDQKSEQNQIERLPNRSTIEQQQQFTSVPPNPSLALGALSVCLLRSWHSVCSCVVHFLWSTARRKRERERRGEQWAGWNGATELWPPLSLLFALSLSLFTFQLSLIPHSSFYFSSLIPDKQKEAPKSLNSVPFFAEGWCSCCCSLLLLVSVLGCARGGSRWMRADWLDWTLKMLWPSTGGMNLVELSGIKEGVEMSVCACVIVV